MSKSEKASDSVRGWFGLRSRADEPSNAAPTRRSDGPVKAGRRQLLDSIGDFILDHDLDVTPTNLTLGFEAFSGTNPRLARQIVSRAQAGTTITQDWLDETTAAIQETRDTSVQQLMTSLEATLDALGKTSTAARSATAHYGDALEQHVTELQEVQQDPGQIIDNLAELARAMLDRTRKVEGEMRQSEEEAKSLRKKLAAAQRDAEIDHLTGLPNRRAFEALLDSHYREAQAAIEPLSVAFCDIDHFKRINDTHGHDSGDRVIKEIADTLARISNDKCHVARHGGEEFVMLFRGLTPSEAKVRLDEARETMAARNLINRKTDQPFGQITFSGGVADVFGYPDPREALKAADEALYQAKEGGRNQIALA